MNEFVICVPTYVGINLPIRAVEVRMDLIDVLFDSHTGLVTHEPVIGGTRLGILLENRDNMALIRLGKARTSNADSFLLWLRGLVLLLFSRRLCSDRSSRMPRGRSSGRSRHDILPFCWLLRNNYALAQGEKESNPVREIIFLTDPMMDQA